MIAMTTTDAACGGGATLCLDVGGVPYKISRSLLKQYPHSTFSRMPFQETNRPIYIDRNGHRFQYVLDFMRDQEIHLPMTESRLSVQKELEYFGLMAPIEDGDSVSMTDSLCISISHMEALEDAKHLLTTRGGGQSLRREKLEEFDFHIQELEAKLCEYKHCKEALMLARSLRTERIAARRRPGRVRRRQNSGLPN